MTWFFFSFAKFIIFLVICLTFAVFFFYLNFKIMFIISKPCNKNYFFFLFLPIAVLFSSGVLHFMHTYHYNFTLNEVDIKSLSELTLAIYGKYKHNENYCLWAEYFIHRYELDCSSNLSDFIIPF